jgi:hypothetical protein
MSLEQMYKPGCPTCGSPYPSENRTTCPNREWHQQEPLRDVVPITPLDED